MLRGSWMRVQTLSDILLFVAALDDLSWCLRPTASMRTSFSVSLPVNCPDLSLWQMFIDLPPSYSSCLQAWLHPFILSPSSSPLSSTTTTTTLCPSLSSPSHSLSFFLSFSCNLQYESAVACSPQSFTDLSRVIWSDCVSAPFLNV